MVKTRMENDLQGVLNRHKEVNPSQLMHHDKLGFKNEDKKAVDDHAKSGGDKNEVGNLQASSLHQL